MAVKLNEGIVGPLIADRPTGTVAVGRHGVRHNAHAYTIVVRGPRTRLRVLYFGPGGRPVVAGPVVAATYRPNDDAPSHAR